jgi:hypothetical protein
VAAENNLAAPAQKPKPRKPRSPSKPFINLPPDFCPVDASIPEVMSFRRERRTAVERKLRDGTYQSYLSGNRRLIIFESVLRDRETCIARGPQLGEAPSLTEPRDRSRPRVSPPLAPLKRGRGRPSKTLKVDAP